VSVTNPDALLWKYGLPGCTITVIGGEIAAWSGCSIGTPTQQQIDEAESEYGARLASLALDQSAPDEWRPWANDDMDTGVETLLEWAAPAVNAAWKVHGRIVRGTAAIAFEALLHLTCVTDGYGGLVRTVNLTVQHTSTSGDVSGVAWVDGADALYSDYDATSGMVRLRLSLPSDNWAARGKWQRFDTLEAMQAA
jgi:hypothetical protein